MSGAPPRVEALHAPPRSLIPSSHARAATYPCGARGAGLAAGARVGTDSSSPRPAPAGPPAEPARRQPLAADRAPSDALVARADPQGHGHDGPVRRAPRGG